MKFITIALISLVCVISYSCKQGKIKNGTNNIDTLIVGNWEMCRCSFKQIKDGTSYTNTISYNACPEVVFKNYNTGYTINPDKEKFLFNWEINENGLKINYKSGGNKSPLFLNGNYKIAITGEKSFTEIILADSLKGNKFYLGKESP